MAGSNNQIKKTSGAKRPGESPIVHGGVSDDVNMHDVATPDRAWKKAREEFEIAGCADELVALLNEQLEAVDLQVQQTLSTYKATGSQNKPWASEWKTERLWIAIPVSGMSVDASLIDQVILCAIKNARSRVTITQGLGVQDIPTLSAEDEKFMGGLLSALAGSAPSTLKTGSSSIIDLTFYACWNLAAARLVSDKVKRQHLHPSVLPEKPVRGGSASEYLQGRFRALKATLGLEHSYLADTLERVLKLWSEVNAERTFSLLARTKISWNLVLSKGGEFKVKTAGKSRTQVRQLTTPLNPKDAAWLMPYERKILSHLCAPIWGRVDAIGKEWAALPAEDTHLSFDSFVNKVKLAYKEMHRVSESVVRRLGLRKSAVMNSAPVRALSKRQSKEKKPNELVLIFYKSNLTTLHKGAKAIFEPIFVGEIFADEDELKNVLKGVGFLQAVSEHYSQLRGMCSSTSNKLLIDWEAAWAKAFEPPTDLSPKDRPTTALETSNLFVALEDILE